MASLDATGSGSEWQDGTTWPGYAFLVHAEVTKLWSRYCAKGYTGVLCAQCRDGFGLTQPFVCRECSRWFRVAIAAMELLAILFLAVNTHFTLHTNRQGRSTHATASDLLK